MDPTMALADWSLTSTRNLKGQSQGRRTPDAHVTGLLAYVLRSYRRLIHRLSSLGKCFPFLLGLNDLLSRSW
jgi:hypothetical protein